VLPAVIAFAFDPFLRFGDRAISLQTLGVAVAAFVGILAAGLLAGRARPTPPDADPAPAAGIAPTRPASTPPAPTPSPNASAAAIGHLRRDDLLFIVVGIVPGAVVGGRLGYVLLHLDYYFANPSAILDPSQGGLQLSLAIVGGALTGAVVAALLEGRVGDWARLAVVPMLGAILLGKVAMALGGSGQGSAWPTAAATAYLGPGPWGSLAPAIPAYPSQLLEAALTGCVVLVAAALLGTGHLVRPDGRAFLGALAMWLVARFVVAFTWRDAEVLGPLRADQLISLAILAGCALLVLAISRRAHRAATAQAAGERATDASPGRA
jgi:phosphatidylglycerol:prolipoprotein diacylglycerol transferase